MKIFESTLPMEKPAPGATGKQALLTKQSNRTVYLSDQIFSHDYARKSQSSQRVCKCGAEISRADFIFNGARSCAQCRVEKSTVVKSSSADVTFTGRIFRQRHCTDCATTFWHWITDRKICPKCSEPSTNDFTFLATQATAASQQGAIL